jgi:YVTN family beta-propeller protein
VFASGDYSKIYSLNGRSDNVSVIDVNSKSVEKVIDLHAYLRTYRLHLPIVLKSVR